MTNKLPRNFSNCSKNSFQILYGMATIPKQCPFFFFFCLFFTIFWSYNYACHFFFFFLVFLSFLGLFSWHMKVSRIGVKSALSPPTYTRATAMQDLSHVCNLHHSSWQCQILNPLRKVRDQTCLLIDTSQIPFC